MIFLDTLIPMQDELRENEQVDGMINFIESGHNWSEEEPIRKHAEANKKHVAPIYITKFPDGKLMIHDGHHRCVAKFLAGSHVLLDGEYLLCEWTYEAYNDIWFDRGYVTPHDPIVEVRLPDFFAFKKKAVELAKTDEKAARDYILANKALYARPRKIWTLAELARAYAPKIKVAG